MQLAHGGDSGNARAAGDWIVSSSSGTHADGDGGHGGGLLLSWLVLLARVMAGAAGGAQRVRFLFSVLDSCSAPPPLPPPPLPPPVELVLLLLLVLLLVLLQVLLLVPLLVAPLLMGGAAAGGNAEGVVKGYILPRTTLGTLRLSCSRCSPQFQSSSPTGPSVHTS